MRIHFPKYERTLFELQNYIFDNFFNQPDAGSIDLESSLISLNKLTISKLKQYIEQDISNSNQNTNNPPASTINNLHDTSPPISKYHHFFSSDAQLENGRYMFPFQLSDVKCVYLSAFKLNCNLYNITESNNKFIISEMDTQVPCSIPLGYYTTDELLECMSHIINTNSKQKYEYTVTRNKTKNKVYIQCSKPFNIYFNSSQNVPVPLQTLLGFHKVEYMNNNTYVSESQPLGNIFDDIYIKLFFNEKEVTKYFTTKPTFSYFHSFQMDYEKHYGKRFFFTPSANDYFECGEKISIDKLSFEIWHTPDRPYTRHMDFDIILSFEADSCPS